MKIFGLNGSRKYAERIASKLMLSVSDHTEKNFSDGEVYVKSNENVRGEDVFVVHSLYEDPKHTVGDKIITLLMFLGSLKDASADRVTVVVPYLAFARQDRKTESRAPIGTKYIAKLLEAAGADRFMTMDIHNLSSIQNAFDIPADNLEAKNLFVDYITGTSKGGGASLVGKLGIDLPENITVMAPDEGGKGRAKRFRNALEKRLNLVNKINMAYLDKERLSGDEVMGDAIIGDVKGRNVILIDDLIASGKTIKISADAVEAHGGNVFAVCATHGLFVGKAQENLSGIDKLIITNTVLPFRLKDKSNLHIISTDRMFAQAMKRTHEGGSISELLEG